MYYGLGYCFVWEVSFVCRFERVVSWVRRCFVRDCRVWRLLFS